MFILERFLLLVFALSNNSLVTVSSLSLTCSCDRSYAGMPISEVFSADIGLGGVLSLLWFRRRLPDYATKFIEMILMVSHWDDPHGKLLLIEAIDTYLIHALATSRIYYILLLSATSRFYYRGKLI